LNEFDRLVGERRGSEIENEVADFLSEDYYMVNDVFRSTFRYSSIIAIYSLLEDTMNDLCRFLQRRQNHSLELTDLDGRGIYRAKLYLEKVCHLEFPSDGHEWKEIEKLNAIRNCLAHTNGKVKTRKVENIVNNTNGLSINEGYPRLIIDEEYIKNVIEYIATFLNQMLGIALV